MLMTSNADPSVRLAARSYTPCMRKLDKLNWTPTVMVTMHGGKVGVRAATPELLAELMNHLPARAAISPAREGVVDRVISVIAPSQGPNPRIRNFGLVYLDHVEVTRTHSLAEMIDSYQGWLRFSLAQFVRRGIVVHGGAVGWRGKAVLLPARSGSGKSHLVAELLKLGAEYITDEHILLDALGRIHPWYKPLSIRAGPGGRQTDVRPEDLHARIASRSMPVTMILSTTHGPAPQWPPQNIPPAQGAIELLSNTIAARIFPRRVMETLSRAAQQAQCFKGARPDATIAGHDILKMLEAINGNDETVASGKRTGWPGFA